MAQGSGMEGFSDLPEGCISHIISLTSPRDAIRFSVMTSIFQSAAESDVVWDRFLPSDYQEIISRSVSPVVFTSKKDLYFHLCDSPILLDGGTKSFALDKLSGKKCYMLGARELTVTCEFGETPYRWNTWTPQPECASLSKSRNLEVAHLDVWGIDIEAKMNTQMLSPDTTYGAYLVYTIADDAYGFGNPPVYLSMRFVGSGGGVLESKAEGEPNIAYLQSRLSIYVPETLKGQLGQERGDGWMEIEIGELFNGRDNNDEMEMRVWQIVFNWRPGIAVQGIELRPKGI